VREECVFILIGKDVKVVIVISLYAAIRGADRRRAILIYLCLLAEDNRLVSGHLSSGPIVARLHSPSHIRSRWGLSFSQLAVHSCSMKYL
jgi:hypothetical protein